MEKIKVNHVVLRDVYNAAITDNGDLYGCSSVIFAGLEPHYEGFQP